MKNLFFLGLLIIFTLSPQPRPLVNFSGVNCYMNSAVQALYATPEIRQLIPYFEYTADSLGHLFQELIIALNNNKDIELALRQFYRKIPTVITTIQCNRQEDSSEFLGELISHIDINSKILDIFQIFTDEIKYNISNKLIYNDPTQMYFLPIPVYADAKNPQTTTISNLDEAFSLYSRIQSPLTGDPHSNFIQQNVLAGLSNYCIVSLRRFYSQQIQNRIEVKKIKASIEIPLVFDFKKYFQQDFAGNAVYELYGAVLHFGDSPHSGHYTAYVKWDNNTWYYCNDASITPKTSMRAIQKEINENAYILFYKKTDQESTAITEDKLNKAIKEYQQAQAEGINRYDQNQINQELIDLKNKLQQLQMQLNNQ